MMARFDTSLIRAPSITGKPADRLDYSFTLNNAILNVSEAGRTLQPFFISGVAMLEDLLSPYADDKYNEEVEMIEKEFKETVEKNKNRSQSELAIIIWQKMRKKFKALVFLAKRKRFLIEESAVAYEGVEEGEEVVA
jgi:hypothetical protein